MPDTSCEYYIVELERLVSIMKADEALLKAKGLLPFARETLVKKLSFQRNHFSGIAKIARMAGATHGMVQEVLDGKTEVMVQDTKEKQI